MTCNKCGNEANWLINGRCSKCNPFNACPKCEIGTYKSQPTASWQNRHVCDYCGHKVSR